MKKKLCMILALAMVVGTIFTGCGVGSKNEDAAGQKQEGEKKSTVVYGTPTAPAGTFQPILAYMSSDNLIDDAIYASLLEMKPDGSLEESLCESYSVSEDQKTIEFVLREGVKWHDGEDVTAEDVAFTYESYGKTADDFGKVSRIEGAQDFRDGKTEHMSGISYEGNKITIKLTEVYSPFVNKIGVCSIVPKHIWGEIPFEKWQEQTELLNNPIGCGAYKMVKYTSGESVELEANKDYFAGAPKIDKFIFKVVNPDAIAAELSSGNVDIVEAKELKSSEIADLEKEGFTKYSIADNMYQYVSFNMRMPIFQDKALRQAITYAIDRKAILENIVEGRGTLVHAPFIPGGWAAPSDSDVNTYDYNPDKAVELLESAGWKDSDGDGIRENAKGEKLQFKLRCSNDSKTRENAVLYVKECLKKVGIEIEVSIEEDGLVAEDCIYNHNYEMYALNCYFSADPDPYYWWSSESASDEPGQPSFNFGSYKNDSVDKNIQDALKTNNQDERAKYYLDIAKQINEDAPMIFLYVQNREIMTNPNLKGFNPGTFNLYYDIAKWEMTK